MMIETSYPSRLAGEEPRAIERVEPVVWGSEGDGPLGTEQLAAYEKSGYVDFPALVDAERLRALSAEVDRLVEYPFPSTDERVIREPGSKAVRSIFEVHRLSGVVAGFAASSPFADIARQVLGSEVYIHQSRLNLKPGLTGEAFYWHSDFETWHHEDGMPRMRALTMVVSLTDNLECNGSLMIIPGSHRTFVGCLGETPDNHYRDSLRSQRYGVPSERALRRLVADHGIDTITGPSGSVVFFDSNCMHGSNSNITPYPRRNLFLVYNSVVNELGPPVAGTRPRPEFLGSRVVEPLGSQDTGSVRERASRSA